MLYNFYFSQTQMKGLENILGKIRKSSLVRKTIDFYINTSTTLNITDLLECVL